MINTKSLELGNIVYVNEKLTGTVENLRGEITGMMGNQVKLNVNGDEITCLSDQIYSIPLFRDEILGLGFTPRSLNTATETKNDYVMSITEKGEVAWYLLEMTEDNMLTVKKNGVEVLGSGKATSLHHLQNLVNQITDGKIKIEGI